MRVKKVNGELVIISTLRTEIANTDEMWVLWSDIKPIIEELQVELSRHQEEVENEQFGCSDYSLMTKDS